MTYKTVLTIKGTTTIPIEVRKQLGLKPGMYVSFVKDKSGEIILRRSPTIEEIRELNKQTLKNTHHSPTAYKSGDGFGAYVSEKYRTTDDRH